jgi:hypothetical protein
MNGVIDTSWCTKIKIVEKMTKKKDTVADVEMPIYIRFHPSTT